MAMRNRDEFELQQVRDIGAFFRQLRFKRNKSQKDEAAEIGCSQATLTYFEKGRDDYRFSMLQKIAHHYGYRVEVSLVPVDESITTRVVARPDPDFEVPVNGVRDTKYGREPSEITSEGVRKPRARKPQLVPDVQYDTEDEFDTQAELAAMRKRLGLAS